MVLRLRFDLAVITSARLPQGRGQTAQKSSLAKAPMMEAEREENPAQGSDKEPRVLESGTAKTNRGRKLRRLSLRVQKTSGWGRKSSLLWLEEHIANKILIPLQSLVPCSPPANRWVAVGAPGCPNGSAICCALVAVAQVAGGSSVLNLLYAEDQANENCKHRSGT